MQWSWVTLGSIAALKRGCRRGFDLLAQHQEADSRLLQRCHVVACMPSNMRAGECLHVRDVWWVPRTESWTCKQCTQRSGFEQEGVYLVRIPRLRDFVEYDSAKSPDARINKFPRRADSVSDHPGQGQRHWRRRRQRQRAPGLANSTFQQARVRGKVSWKCC